MNDSEDKSKEESAAGFRILTEDLFLYLLDLEVKRARRYQNFISILLLKLAPSSKKGNGTNFETCHQTLTNVLKAEMRETDILGSLGTNGLVALLPYADVAAGRQAKTRFEKTLDCYDFKNKGYDVTVHQFCYPRNGTNTFDLIKKALETEIHDSGVMT
jgi:hypothetical protein